MSEKVKAGFKPKYSDDDGLLTVEYWDAGEIVSTVSFQVEDLAESAIYKHWLLQGLFTTLSARASTYKGTSKLDYMSMTFDLWCEGTWSPERKGGIRTVSVEVEALARVKAASIPDASRAYKALSAEKQAALLKHPSMVAMIATLRTEREAEADLSLEDMLES
jgi:hypothetical protein